MTERRIPELDGIRGLAILSVIYWHYIAAPRALAPLHTLNHALYRIGILSWSGVDLFFVLSGFLIGGVLIAERQSPAFFRPFYLRRFFRIVPLYALVCIGATALLKVQPTGVSILGKPMPLIVCLAFLQDFWLAHHAWDVYLAVTWSLAVEEQFYVIFPFLVRFLSQSLLRPATMILIAGSMLSRAVLYLHFGSEWGAAAYTLIFCRADALLLGVLGALIIRDARLRAKLTGDARILRAAVWLSGAAIAVFFLKGWTMQTRPMSTVGYSCLAAFYLSLLLSAVVRRDGWWPRVLRAPWLRHLGRVAYCLYLVHVSTLAIAEYVVRRATGRSGPNWTGAVLGFILALALAEFSWRFLESTMIRFGHRFTYGVAAPAPSQVTVIPASVL